MAAIAASLPIDTTRIRQDFPILHQAVNGCPLVYLDNAATTQKPRQVIEALVRYYETDNANVHRGIHTLSMRASDQYEGARERVARFIGARHPSEIVFTRNTTESINLVAHAWGEQHLQPGDEILLTPMEHHSNLVPWQMVAKRTGARLRFAALTPAGELDVDSLRALAGPRTRIIALAHASNVLGTINPVAEVAQVAHETGALLLLDGAQSVPHLPVDVGALGCDFLAFSAHKMLGPTGLGILWARRSILEEIEPYLGGGGMIARVQPEFSTWADAPSRFEAGTPNIAGAIAFAAALDYLDSVGLERVRQHEVHINELALDRLPSIPGLTLFGPPDPERRTAVFSFSLDGVHPHDVATILDTQGIAIRAGHHCAQVLMRTLDVPATGRASFYLYNTPDELDALVDGLMFVRRTFA